VFESPHGFMLIPEEYKNTNLITDKPQGLRRIKTRKDKKIREKILDDTNLIASLEYTEIYDKQFMYVNHEGVATTILLATEENTIHGLATAPKYQGLGYATKTLKEWKDIQYLDKVSISGCRAGYEGFYKNLEMDIYVIGESQVL